MGFLMGEWYGIFWHSVLMVLIGLVIGLALGHGGDDKPVVPPAVQASHQETGAGITQSDFMRRWCAVNYGISTKGERQ